LKFWGWKLPNCPPPGCGPDRQHWQPGKDKQNFDVGPPGKISADAHAFMQYVICHKNMVSLFFFSFGIPTISSSTDLNAEQRLLHKRLYEIRFLSPELFGMPSSNITSSSQKFACWID